MTSSPTSNVFYSIFSWKFSLDKLLHLLIEILDNCYKRYQQRASSFWPFQRHGILWVFTIIITHCLLCFLGFFFCAENRIKTQKPPLHLSSILVQESDSTKIPLRTQVRVNFTLEELHRGNQFLLFPFWKKSICFVVYLDIFLKCGQ